MLEHKFWTVRDSNWNDFQQISSESEGYRSQSAWPSFDWYHRSVSFQTVCGTCDPKRVLHSFESIAKSTRSLKKEEWKGAALTNLHLLHLLHPFTPEANLHSCGPHPKELVDDMTLVLKGSTTLIDNGDFFNCGRLWKVASWIARNCSWLLRLQFYWEVHMTCPPHGIVLFKAFNERIFPDGTPYIQATLQTHFAESISYNGRIWSVNLVVCTCLY